MSNSKKTVLVVTGTRAEYGLLRPVMREIQKSKKLRLQVLATGMHTLKSRGNTQDEIKKEGFPLVCVVPISEKDSMLDALSKEIKGISDYVTSHRPDLILVLGDRDEPFAAAIVGGHLGIPVAHLNGGDKTGMVVDEYIRHAITKFSHLHAPISHKSARRVKWLGEEAWRISMTGGSGLDELREFKTLSKSALAKKYKLSEKEPWYFILYHPAALDPVPPLKQIQPFMRAVSKLKGVKIVSSPNADTGADTFFAEIWKYEKKPDFHIFPHIPRIDLVGMLKNSKALIGNSSMGIIDASFLRTPTVNVGSRQAGREQGGNVVNATYDEKSIEVAIKKVLSPAFQAKVKKGKSPYGDGRAAGRIVRHIEKNIGRPNLFHKKLTYV